VTDATLTVAEPDLTDPSLYFNRELSWLEFNARVLELAEDPSVPLLERLKFCAIYSSNLDEFFMVRVAGLHDQVDAGIDKRGQDGRAPQEALDAIRRRTQELGRRLTRCMQDDLRPQLAEHGIRIVGVEDIEPEERRLLADRFRRQIFPVLTPSRSASADPSPTSRTSRCRSGSSSATRRTASRRSRASRCRRRSSPLHGDRDGKTFVPLEDVIAKHLDQLFPGWRSSTSTCSGSPATRTSRSPTRPTTSAGGRRRAAPASVRRGRPRRGRVGDEHEDARGLVDALGAEPEDVFEVEGLLDLQDLWDILKVPGHRDLRDPPWSPVTQPRLQGSGEKDSTSDVMGAMRRGDILLHHPYDSFSSSVERLVEQAVNDPKVLAIKQTVYRTSDDSPLVPALIRAAERGKQAVCLVELKARFDERANIGWARALEEGGVHVVYGHPALKTHAKCVLIVRREGDGVRHYVHIGTGNYHPKTARLYTDFGLLTCNEVIGNDVADMYNFLTGFGRPRHYRKVLVAPNHMRDGLLDQIERTIAAHGEGAPARIRLKMNSLVDGKLIRALYKASQAGVPVELNIRGICCLKPGVPGVSENIRVVSIVGRFLEHSRVFAFERGEECDVFIGSADWMPRNLDTRVELVAPVEDDALRADLLDNLERCFADDTNAWDLASDGDWTRRVPAGPEPRSVQRELMLRHHTQAHEIHQED
jgi:polyphosphate kinase